MHRILLTGAMAAAALGAQANLVVNGDFETGDFTAWTVTLAANGSNLDIFSGGINGSNWYASFGATNAEYDTITQVLPTVNGQQYDVSFLVYNLGVGEDSLQILWEGSVSLDMTIVSTELESWVQITHSVMATQNGSQFGVQGFDGLSAVGVDAIEVSAVPEPGTCAVLAAGIGALALRRRSVR